MFGFWYKPPPGAASGPPPGVGDRVVGSGATRLGPGLCGTVISSCEGNRGGLYLPDLGLDGDPGERREGKGVRSPPGQHRLGQSQFGGLFGQFRADPEGEFVAREFLCEGEVEPEDGILRRADEG